MKSLFPARLALTLFLTAVAPMNAKDPAPIADRPAQPVLTVAPSVPYLMRRAEAAAEVTVAFTVNAAGRVTEATIVESNNPDFVKPALEAVRQWTFTPAIKDGKPVASQLEQTFTFNVRDQAEAERAAQLASKKRTRK